MAESVRSNSWGRDVQTVVERRKSPRTPLVVRVSYSTVDAFFSEFASNVNEGGLFIETETPPPLDTRVTLHFQLPGSEEPLFAEGRVAGCRAPGGDEPPGIGVEFEGLSLAARARINELVRRLRTPQADVARSA